MVLSVSKRDAQRSDQGQPGVQLNSYELLELREFERGTDEAVAVKAVLGEPLAGIGNRDEALVPLVIVGYDQLKIEQILKDERRGFGALRPIAVVGLDAAGLSADILHLADVFLPPRPGKQDLLGVAHSLAVLSTHIDRLPRAPRDVSLTLLQFLYTRGRDVEPHVAPESPIAYRFPLAENLLECDTLECCSLLQDMASRGLLDTRHIDRLFVCPDCSSYRVPVKELCPECGSSHLDAEESIHHFRCGFVGPESEFAGKEGPSCPKCFQELRHIGVEYNRPGRFAVCRQCNYWATEPDLAAWCADCNTHHAPADLAVVQIDNYALAQGGTDVARRGRWTPQPVDNDRRIEPTVGAPTPRKLSDNDYSRELAFKVVELAQQSGRPMTIYKAVLNSGQGDKALADAREVLRGILRDSDVVVNTGEAEMLILLPAHDVADVPSAAHLEAEAEKRGAIDLRVTVVDGGHSPAGKIKQA